MNISSQLDKASANEASGLPVDFDWMARAKTAKRHKGIQHQHILRQLSKFKKQERLESQHSLERAFVDASKIMLDSETFNNILNTAASLVSQKSK